MLRRYLHRFAYLLLLLMPLQSISAANMLVCNSLLQANHHLSLQTKPLGDTTESSMSCHDVKAKIADKHQPSSTATEKSHCSALCSNLFTAALPDQLDVSFKLNTNIVFIPLNPTYVSVTLPAFQRPPIFLSSLA